MSMGYQHACALLDDYSVPCWGTNTAGQLGYGDNVRRNFPPASQVVDLDGDVVRSIASGEEHSCVLLETGAVRCWGQNNYGQLGYADTINRFAPGPALDFGGHEVTSLALGGFSSCAVLDDSSVRCWGWNYYGQLGYGDGAVASEPPVAAIDLGIGRTAIDVHAGTFHVCALLDDHSFKCWGYNYFGQLG